MNYKWRRVNKEFKCPICGKPDYCTVCPELDMVLCMRVASDKPSNCNLGGWIHRLNGAKVKTPPPPPPKPHINATQIMRDFWRHTTDRQRHELAERLGVSVFSLRCLGASWAEAFRAWAFPMMDGYGNIVGVRLRSMSGFKWCITGSTTGVFLPIDLRPQPDVYITEGPTDTAAAITMGLFPIGRASCSSCVDQTITAVRRLRFERAVIVPDNDVDPVAAEATMNGATKLSENLPVPNCITILPGKDLRQFYRDGGTAQLLESLTSSLVWVQPRHQREEMTTKTTTSF